MAILGQLVLESLVGWRRLALQSSGGRTARLEVAVHWQKRQGQKKRTQGVSFVVPSPLSGHRDD